MYSSVLNLVCFQYQHIIEYINLVVMTFRCSSAAVWCSCKRSGATELGALYIHFHWRCFNPNKSSKPLQYTVNQTCLITHRSDNSTSFRSLVFIIELRNVSKKRSYSNECVEINHFDEVNEVNKV